MYKFVKSPTAEFRLAYHVGEIVSSKNLKKEILQKLIEGEFVVEMTKSRKKETATAKIKTENS